VTVDGIQALEFLRRQGPYDRAPRPDLILLDLNLPKKDGRQILAEIKGDPGFRQIPIVILTSSDAENDVAQSYALGANCYVTKPVDLKAFQTIVQAVEGFWFTVVKLPAAG
jgi:CheY-like chemotaxis protein